MSAPIGWLEKGIPYGETVEAESVGRKGWNVRQGDLPLPSLTLRESSLEHNIQTMARWCKQKGFALAPHGKTTMCPRIFHRQMEAGAWGITAATASQALVCLHFGIRRVLIANQLTGAGNVRSLASAVRDHPEVEVYCLADSIVGVEQLAAAWRESAGGRKLGVLLEFGRSGWRTGVRNQKEAEQMRQAITRHSGVLEFAGVEAFEGIASDTDVVDDFLGQMTRAAAEFAGTSKERLLFSVGGSAYLGPVGRHLSKLSDEWLPLIRSGCYVTHDHGFYADTQQAALAAFDEGEVPAFSPALELWAYIQSLPDSGSAILTFGKRDCSYDLSLPVPLDIPDAKVSHLNDQHAFLTYDKATPLKVGDIVRLGISHPCTAFDKWRVIPVVDDDDTVIDLYRTYF